MLSAIYALRDPSTGEVRYVGKANNPQARLKSHMRAARSRNTPVYCWIRSLKDKGLEPQMEVLEWTEDWKSREKALILQHKSDRLLNLAEGGDEPHCSKEQRQANGRKAAKQRDPMIWALRRNLGEMISCFRKSGDVSRAEMLVAARDLFDRLSPEKQTRLALRLGR